MSTATRITIAATPTAAAGATTHTALAMASDLRQCSKVIQSKAFRHLSAAASWLANPGFRQEKVQ
jgi:hypothetical protein